MDAERDFPSTGAAVFFGLIVTALLLAGQPTITFVNPEDTMADTGYTQELPRISYVQPVAWTLALSIEDSLPSEGERLAVVAPVTPEKAALAVPVSAARPVAVSVVTRFDAPAKPALLTDPAKVAAIVAPLPGGTQRAAPQTTLAALVAPNPDMPPLLEATKAAMPRDKAPVASSEESPAPAPPRLALLLPETGTPVPAERAAPPAPLPQLAEPGSEVIAPEQKTGTVDATEPSRLAALPADEEAMTFEDNRTSGPESAVTSLARPSPDPKVVAEPASAPPAVLTALKQPDTPAIPVLAFTLPALPDPPPQQSFVVLAALDAAPALPEIAKTSRRFQSLAASGIVLRDPFDMSPVTRASALFPTRAAFAAVQQPQATSFDPFKAFALTRSNTNAASRAAPLIVLTSQPAPVSSMPLPSGLWTLVAGLLALIALHAFRRRAP